MVETRAGAKTGGLMAEMVVVETRAVAMIGGQIAGKSLLAAVRAEKVGRVRAVVAIVAGGMTAGVPMLGGAVKAGTTAGMVVGTSAVIRVTESAVIRVTESAVKRARVAKMATKIWARRGSSRRRTWTRILVQRWL